VLHDVDDAAKQESSDGSRALVSQAPSPHVPGEGLRAAEDRGFEPRRVSPPNRISSAPLRVPGAFAMVRDCAGTQVTKALTGRAGPGLTGTARPCCACLVRAWCVRTDRRSRGLDSNLSDWMEICHAHCQPRERPGFDAGRVRVIRTVWPGRPGPDRTRRIHVVQPTRERSPRGTVRDRRQALDTPAVRAVYTAFEAAPGPGRMQPPNLAMLRAACEGADVELGAYDLRILAWLAGWEPQLCAVVAGLITRAGSHGEAVRP